MMVRVLGAQHRRVIDAFLRAGGSADAWLRHKHRERGERGFLGVFDGEELVGLALLASGALAAASRTSDAAARALVPAIRSRDPWYSVVGPERPCAILVDALVGRSPPRVNRVQAHMSVSDRKLLADGEPQLRPAGPRDLAKLLPLTARYRVEDGLASESEDSRAWLEAHLEARIRRKSVYVVTEGGRIVFTGAFNFRGEAGSGLGGIYTIPEARGRGVATRATAQLCRIGLDHGPVVTLHVDKRNAAAIRCYEKVGFAQEGEFRLTFR
jgi:RimJ/RimL family protein N-acetyltransferase